MTASEAQRSYHVEQGEKVTSVMIYTQDLFLWGEVVTKEAVRVSTWLRTAAVPRYIFLHDARIMLFAIGGPPKTQLFNELHLPSSQVVVFHLKPPANDPLDYDPQEPMRKMEPVTAIVGSFRFDGDLRMSTQTSLDRFLDVAKETYSSLYDVSISNPVLSAMGVIRVPQVLLRGEMVLFSPRKV
jgi:hypothetical protein